MGLDTGNATNLEFRPAVYSGTPVVPRDQWPRKSLPFVADNRQYRRGLKVRQGGAGVSNVHAVMQSTCLSEWASLEAATCNGSSILANELVVLPEILTITTVPSGRLVVPTTVALPWSMATDRLNATSISDMGGAVGMNARLVVGLGEMSGSAAVGLAGDNASAFGSDCDMCVGTSVGVEGPETETGVTYGAELALHPNRSKEIEIR